MKSTEWPNKLGYDLTIRRRTWEIQRPADPQEVFRARRMADDHADMYGEGPTALAAISTATRVEE